MVKTSHCLLIGGKNNDCVYNNQDVI